MKSKLYSAMGNLPAKRCATPAHHTTCTETNTTSQEPFFDSLRSPKTPKHQLIDRACNLPAGLVTTNRARTSLRVDRKRFRHPL